MALLNAFQLRAADSGTSRDEFTGVNKVGACGGAKVLNENTEDQPDVP